MNDTQEKALLHVSRFGDDLGGVRISSKGPMFASTAKALERRGLIRRSPLLDRYGADAESGAYLTRKGKEKVEELTKG